MIFTTKRLILRPWEESDAQSLFNMPVILMLDRLQDGHPIKVWNKV